MTWADGYESEPEHEAGTAQHVRPLNILPALPSDARMHPHFPGELEPSATAAERKEFIARCRHQLRVLSGTIRLKETSGEMAHEERSWYAATITAIHLCRPPQEQIQRQEEALERAEQRLTGLAEKIQTAKDRLLALEEQQEVAIEWVHRHQSALDELKASAPEMDDGRPETTDGELPGPAEPLPVGLQQPAPPPPVADQVQVQQLPDMAIMQRQLNAISSSLSTYQQLSVQVAEVSSRHDALLSALRSGPEQLQAALAAPVAQSMPASSAAMAPVLAAPVPQVIPPRVLHGQVPHGREIAPKTERLQSRSPARRTQLGSSLPDAESQRRAAASPAGYGDPAGLEFDGDLDQVGREGG